MKIVLKSLIYFIITIYPLTAQDGWEWQNPYPTVEDLVYVKSYSLTNTIVITSSCSYLETTDGGKNWMITQNSFDTLNTFSKVQFVDENNGYALGYGIYISEYSSIIEYGYTLLKTENGGKNWVVIDDKLKNCRLFYFINPDIGWIVGDNGYLKKTTNGGVSWIELPAIESEDNNLKAVYFLNANKGFVAGDQVYMTEDGGLSWKIVHGPIDGGIRSIYFYHDYTGWIGGEQSILKTEDGGKSWQIKGTGSLNLREIVFLNQYEGFAIGEGIYKTEDCGETWIKQEDGRFNSISFLDNQNVWVVGSNGIILKMSDYGYSWNKITKGTMENLNAVFFVDDNIGWVAGDNGTVLNTINGGLNWTMQNSNTSKNLHSIHFINTSAGWIVGDGIILYTKDSGYNWQIYENEFMNDPKFVHFIDETNGWIGGHDAYLLRTYDGGECWYEFQFNFSFFNGFDGAYFINDQCGWFYDDSYIYKTNDGGPTIEWAKKILDSDYGTTKVNSIFFLNEGLGWISLYFFDCCYGTFGGLGITKDEGWTFDCQLNRYGGIDDFCFFDSLNGYAIKHLSFFSRSFRSRSVYFCKTSNGGVNWESKPILVYQAPSDYEINDMCFTDSDHGWIVGNYGMILKTNTGGGVVNIPETRGIKIENYVLKQNYPNPFNPTTVISYQLAVGSEVDISVYNLLGQKVAILVSERQPAGFYEVEFNGQNLSSGVYIYRIQAGEWQDVKKMILLK